LVQRSTQGIESISFVFAAAEESCTVTILSAKRRTSPGKVLSWLAQRRGQEEPWYVEISESPACDEWIKKLSSLERIRRISLWTFCAQMLDCRTSGCGDRKVGMIFCLPKAA